MDLNNEHSFLVNSEFPFGIRELEGCACVNNNKLHRNNFFKIYFIRTGSGSLFVDFMRHDVTDFSVHFVAPRQLEKLEVTPQTCGDLICFGEDLFWNEIINIPLRDYCIEMLSQLSSLSLTSLQFQSLFSLLQNVKQEYVGKTKYRREKIRLYFRVFILQLTEMAEVVISSDLHCTKRALCYKFEKLVEKQYKEIRFVTDYAGLMNLSCKKLNQLTRKYKGQSALEVIHDRILLEAKRLVIHSQQTYKEIAYELGFDSPSAFSKFILAKTGFTPSELKLHMDQIYKPLE